MESVSPPEHHSCARLGVEKLPGDAYAQTLQLVRERESKVCIMRSKENSDQLRHLGAPGGGAKRSSRKRCMTFPLLSSQKKERKEGKKKKDKRREKTKTERGSEGRRNRKLGEREKMRERRKRKGKKGGKNRERKRRVDKAK